MGFDQMESCQKCLPLAVKVCQPTDNVVPCFLTLLKDQECRACRCEMSATMWNSDVEICLEIMRQLAENVDEAMNCFAADNPFECMSLVYTPAKQQACVNCQVK